MDGLLCLRSTTTSFWHTRCRRGPSTPTILSRSPKAFRMLLDDLADLYREHVKEPLLCEAWALGVATSVGYLGTTEPEGCQALMDEPEKLHR